VAWYTDAIGAKADRGSRRGLSRRAGCARARMGCVQSRAVGAHRSVAGFEAMASPDLPRSSPL